MITSTANQQVKLLVQLNKKRKLRDERGVFVVEGPKMFREAPKERIEKVYFSETFYEKHKETLTKRIQADGLEFEVMQDHIFKTASDTQTPQGVLCIVRQQASDLPTLLRAEKPLLLLLENLQDPGNLGTILRTAEGAGVTGVILSKGCVDLYNPKTIRSTMGSVYRMPVLTVDSISDILPELKKQGVRTYAAHLRGEHFYDQEDFRGKTAFFIGNEGNGLSDELSGQADCLIKIPMQGQVESLNAAMAAGILMYETSRQRRKVL